MIDLTFPDGSVRPYPEGVTPLDVAKAISPSLAKRTVLAKVDGELRDVTRPLQRSARLELVARDAPEALETLRHDTSHLMAEAVQELFPGTQVTIGPAIEDGFYYDFARDEPFHLDDLARIEARMKQIVDRDEAFTREEWDRAEAITLFQGLGEHYKAEIIEGLPEGEPITIYRQGKWYDLCRGPHLPSTARSARRSS
jgi:threonyl-tRNA synthetase